MNDNITILVEPTAACNLRCKHCYHAKTNYDGKIMSLGKLSEFLQKCAPYYKFVKIIWHGGEPLMAGIDFFVEAYKLFEQYSQKYLTEFKFSIQTNGTLLTQDFVDLFAKTGTRICISFDGSYNDVLRQQTDKTQAVITLLQTQKIKFNCLSTISSASVENLITLYNYFKVRHIPVKFNPIYPDGAATAHQNYVIGKEIWTKNFIGLFDYWLQDKNCDIHVASCCDILKKYLGKLSYGCIGGTCLYRYLAIDAYGNLYPCGRTICDELLLANISDLEDIRGVFLSDNYVYILDCNKARINTCSNCKWFGKCHSGCNASAYIDGNISKANEFDCYFTRKVFEHIKEILPSLSLEHINPYAKEIICDKKI